MRSDFIFDRNVSNLPFFPLAYLSTSINNSIELDNCPAGNSCEFSYLNVSQGFGWPIWVGQKDMIIIGETLELDQLNVAGESYDLVNAGLLATWIRQASQKWQLGAFIYAYDGIYEDGGFTHSGGSYSGFVSRYRHNSHVHTYWGAVRVDEVADVSWYPYAGFDWFIGKKWRVSFVMPWPAVSYAPTTNEIYRFGLLFSGSDWSVDQNDQLMQNSLSKVDLGFAYERKLTDLLWLELGAGYSGAGKYVVTSDNGLDFESNLSRDPYFRASLYLRP